MTNKLSAALALALAACAGHANPIPAAPSAQRVQAANDATIVVDAKSHGPVVSADMYGASLDTWYDFLKPWVNPSLRKAGIHLVRFPGGSESDAYHWENGGTLCDKQGYILKPSTFDHLMTRLAQPLNLDIAITLNYGSNRECDGGGAPAEAAAWVAYAKQHGYKVSFWTVGNEDYGSWEYDLHAQPHDPHTYSSTFRTGYYPAVKSANAQAKLGVVADFDASNVKRWNDVVFRKARPFDFVEIHYYPEYNVDSDSFLLGSAIDKFARDLAGLRGEMIADGVSKATPIYLGEFNNDAGEEGKQSVSVVNALYLGQMLGTAIGGGVSMSTWWVAYGSCDEKGDYSHQLYGWQHFGSEALFSDGLPEPYDGCPDTPTIAGGTPFPTARVIALLAKTIPAGSTVRKTTVPSAFGTSVRAYGYAVGGGYTVTLYNNTLSAVSVKIGLQKSSKTAYDGTLYTYGKAQYDESKDNQWVGATAQRLGAISVKNLPLQLPPYSLTILTLT